MQLHQLLKHTWDPVLLSLEVSSDKASISVSFHDKSSHMRSISPFSSLRGEAIKNLSELTHNF